MSGAPRPAADRRWRLDELLPDVNKDTLAKEFSKLDAAASIVEAQRELLLSDTPEERTRALADSLEHYEAAVVRATRLSSYAALWFSENTGDENALQLKNEVEQRVTQLDNRTLFLRLWWQGLDEEEAAAIEAGLNGAVSPDHLFFLRELRRLCPFRLAEEVEQVINTKNADGIDALTSLYSMVTNGFEYDDPTSSEPGAKRTRDELMTSAMSADAEERERCYRELFRVYGQQREVLGQMYVHRVRDWHNENVRGRGYASPLSVRNVANDIPDGVVDVVLDVIRGNAGVFHRYFELKAGWLGVERLRRFDLYAPLSSTSRERVPFEEAREFVISTYARFSPRVGEMAQRVFDQQHLDAMPRKGKRGGAFCASALPSLTPWVLLNYAGRSRDVATMAHELGHAIHSMLGAEHSPFVHRPSLPLAETASVFGEMLITERLLEQTEDPILERELLASAVDDMYATVLRQAFFVLFETEAHRAIVGGASIGDLENRYLANLGEQFGDSVAVDPCFGGEWLAIPHIYAVPFYCYAYSFGQLLALALYGRYQQDGADFVPGYLELLAHGGSARPQEILAEASIDPFAREFWQSGIDVIGTFVDRLESVL